MKKQEKLSSTFPLKPGTLQNFTKFRQNEHSPRFDGGGGGIQNPKVRVTQIGSKLLLCRKVKQFSKIIRGWKGYASLASQLGPPMGFSWLSAVHTTERCLNGSKIVVLRELQCTDKTLKCYRSKEVRCHQILLWHIADIIRVKQWDESLMVLLNYFTFLHKINFEPICFNK